MAVKAMASITLTRIEFIGRNLLLSSNEVITNKSYPITTYKLSEKMIVGQEYTLRLWGTLGAGKTNFTPYLNGGSISLGALKNNGDGTFSSTFVGKDSRVTTGDILHIYPMASTVSIDSTITKIKLEKGDLATDWTEAPEDTQARIDEKADTDLIDNIQTQLDDFVLVEGYETEIGAINQALQDYRELIEAGEVATDEAVADITKLLDRTVLIENNLGEFTQSWNFDVTEITMGEEGLFLGDNLTSMGIRIAPQVGDVPPRIDFMDNGTVVAEITGQYMRINRGIFVQSAQIGEHQIETIAGGHTIWKWIPPTT